MKTEEEKEEAKKGTKEKAIPNEDESMVKFRAALSLLYSTVLEEHAVGRPCCRPSRPPRPPRRRRCRRRERRQRE